MRRAAVLIGAWLAIFAAIPSVGLGQARDLYPNTPDEVIQKRAGQQAKPLWQIPLGPALIEDMQFAGPDRLLVTPRKDFPGLPGLDLLLVDTAGGRILWRYPRDKHKGQYDCLLVLEDVFLFRVDQGKKATLLALDPKTGAEKWAADFNGEKIIFIPFIGGGFSLAVVPGSDSVALTALDPANGRPVWQKIFQVANGAALPAPRILEDDLVVFYDGLERLAGKDGKTVFSRRGTVFPPNCAPPQFEGGMLWAVCRGNRLSALDAASGSEKWAADLPSDITFTNIFPLGERIYVRGVDSFEGHRLLSVSRSDGRILWTNSGLEPSVSNLVESGGMVYFGTPTSLVALNIGDGRQVFSALVTTTGRAFPIRLREVGGRIVYISELVVAAYDARTGGLVYKQGMTPGAQELSLNGLDDAAPNLKEEIKKSSKNPAGGMFRGLASFASAEAARYQNLGSTYRSQLDSAFSRGDSVGYSTASYQQSWARHQAKLQAMTAFIYNIVDVGIMVRQFFITRSIKTAADRQELFRRSILASYAQSETADYVYRPHLLFRDAMDEFSTVSVVHLPTGKRSETLLSPHYLSYGLWQLIDFDKGVIYHCNIGLDPTRYELSESRSYYPYSKARTVNTFLIAQPVKIPR